MSSEQALRAEDAATNAAVQETILDVENLKVHFPIRSGMFGTPQYCRAVDGISFKLKAGETLGVVGESGCGKSTLGRAILQLIEPTDGRVVWLGKEINNLKPKQMVPYRKDMQMIFQDPLASLNPRMTIFEIISEPLRTHMPELSKDEIKTRVKDIMAKVGLMPEMINRFPHEFSGGQCQRIGVARAMILCPKIIVCDEPTSALDVSIQSQIVNLLMELQKEFNLSMIFISHNLSVVRHICHRIMVVYLGKLMELAERDEIYNNPKHPYTQALIKAVPIPDPNIEKNKRHVALKGDPPSPLNPPSGCVFHPRCPFATDICSEKAPVIEYPRDEHEVACHHWKDMKAEA